MRKTTFLLILALMLPLACSRSDEPAFDSARSSQTSSEISSAFIPGSVIVQLDAETADRMADAAADTKSPALVSDLEYLGVTKIERIFPDAGVWEARHRRAGLHRWYRLSFDPEARPVTKAAADFISVPGIVSAEPERKVRSTAYFNDPYATRQWDLDFDVTTGTSYKPGSDINVVQVWDEYTAGSSDVIVAVLDGGVQLDHPDLAAVTIPGGENGSKCFIYGLEGYTIPPDDHGTHVAGVIAAVNNNGIGISGIAGGKDGKGGVRIMSCPFMLEGQFKDRSGNPAEAMVWAADHGAVISQNSWGYVYDTEADAKASGLSRDMKQAIDYFIQYAGCDVDGNQLPDSPMKGGVVIFAAGNESWSIGWPAAYEPVIAVGATTSQCTRTSYSNLGEWVDICAPGGDGSAMTQIFSTIANSDYGFMSGTSMACPHVSGVAALLVSYFGGPGYTNEMLKDRLLRGASTTKVNKNQMIGPMLDALGSFTLDSKEAPLPASGISATASSNTISMSWKVTADPDEKKAYGYIAMASTDSKAVENFDLAAIDTTGKSMTVEVKSRAVGDTISTTMLDLDFDTPYYVAVVAYDYQRNYSPVSDIHTVRTGKNNPPVVATEYTGDYRIRPYEKLAVDYFISDPDGHAFTVAVDPGSTALTYKITSQSVQFVIAGNAAPHGKYTAHIIAKDSYQDSTDYVVNYEILENHAPVAIAQFSNMRFTKTGESQTFDLTKFIKDDDGEPLTYSISMSDQNVAHLNASGNTLTLTTLGYGLTTATITAKDACNTSCTLSFKILIRDGSKPVDIYPNPVVDKLNIRPDQDGSIQVVITNKAGAKVWSDTVEAGPFNPLSVDMSDKPGGMYYVRIDGAGVNDLFTIAKK